MITEVVGFHANRVSHTVYNVFGMENILVDIMVKIIEDRGGEVKRYVLGKGGTILGVVG